MQGQLYLNLGALSDAELVEGLNRVVGSGRRLLAELLAHLCEVEERRLHLDAGYPSLFAYCMARLGFTEDEAYRRIHVARLARKAPIVFTWIAEGRLSLSAAALLQPYVLAPNLQQLIEAVAGKSVKDAREALVAFFPRPDVSASIRMLPRPKREQAPSTPAPEQVMRLEAAVPETRRAAADARTEPALTHANQPPASPASPASHPSSPTQPLSPGRFKLQLTIDATFKDKLELARDLLRHAVPNGDLATILHRALDLLVADVQKRRFGTKRGRNAAPAPTANPKAPSETAANHDTPDHVHPATSERATRRAVCERDGFQCTWQGPDGVRCTARAWLEQDHRSPRALGGATTLQNLRLLCRSHNRRAAELIFGKRHIQRAIIENQNQHRASRPPPAPT